MTNARSAHTKRMTSTSSALAPELGDVIIHKPAPVLPAPVAVAAEHTQDS